MPRPTRGTGPGPGAAPGPSAAPGCRVGYWHVDDIEGSLELLPDAGARLPRAVRDVGGGKLIATMEDADGDVIGLIQPP